MTCKIYPTFCIRRSEKLACLNEFTLKDKWSVVLTFTLPGSFCNLKGTFTNDVYLAEYWTMWEYSWTEMLPVRSVPPRGCPKADLDAPAVSVLQVHPMLTSLWAHFTAHYGDLFSWLFCRLYSGIFRGKSPSFISECHTSSTGSGIKCTLTEWIYFYTLKQVFLKTGP